MKNLFESIPSDINEEVFSDVMQADNVRIERIVSKGHSSPEFGWYDQAENEWVVVLQGEAVISFENEEDAHLMPGSYINIPMHKKHKVSWTKPEIETVWLAVHYK